MHGKGKFNFLVGVKLRFETDTTLKLCILMI